LFNVCHNESPERAESIAQGEALWLNDEPTTNPSPERAISIAQGEALWLNDAPTTNRSPEEAESIAQGVALRYNDESSTIHPRISTPPDQCVGKYTKFAYK